MTETRIARYPDWQSRLQAAIRTRAVAPFAYGAHDCSLAICDLLQAVAVVPDLAEPFRARYRTAAGATRVLRRYLAVTQAFRGWTTPIEAETIEADALLRWVMTARCFEVGLSCVAATSAQRGDPVVIRAPVAVASKRGGYTVGEADCLGMVDLSGAGVLVAGYRGGWLTRPAGAILGAWRVP